MNSDSSNSTIVWTVSDFVAAVNQTLDFAFPFQQIVGEVSNFKVSRNRWVYFDIKDEESSVRCFGSAFSLHTVIEDGMMVVIGGLPRLHPRFGFSVNFETLTPSGEGSIKRASNLLEAKLRKEGLFDDSRKRELPYPPKSIGLITSAESAAYHDFVKVLSERWSGVNIELVDVKVQGGDAETAIARAINALNASSDVEVIVITRGGGSKDDLIAFDSEILVRAVAASRIPTLVAIGHEVDISLSELAADRRASTPSNAAELLVPSKDQTLDLLSELREKVRIGLSARLYLENEHLEKFQSELKRTLIAQLEFAQSGLSQIRRLMVVLHPDSVLKRGYAIVRSGNMSVARIADIVEGDDVKIILQDGNADANITGIGVR